MDILITPSRCTGNTPNNLDQDFLVSEPKLDGSRYVFYIGYDPYKRQKYPNTVLSRRISTVDNKHVDKSQNVPHMTDIQYKGLEGTVLDGEMFLKDFPTTQGIMGSGPKLAIEKQNSLGMMVYYAFDCPVYRGKDIRGLSLEKRRKVLKAVVEKMKNEHVRVIPQWSGQIEERFNRMVNAGGEGVIIKDLRLGYGIGWAKMKKSYETSCFISGFKPGIGKYENSVGSIALSVYDGDKAVEVGFASGFDDKIRHDMSSNPKKYLNKVVDIFAQELSKSNRLRHPTFYRFRTDLNPKDCTLSKLIADCKKKVRSDRWKKGEV